MGTFLEIFENFFVQLTYIVVIGAFLFTLDDLFIDFVAFVRRLRPKRINKAELTRMSRLPQKRIAIMIANWKEAEVIGPMIRGNIRNLKYDNYTFFLGVYPNDTETWHEARKVETQFPDKVHVVVNSKPGPTSKGQMLNEIARQIFASETDERSRYDLFLMQDSEDVLHPYSLSLLNDSSRDADFVQIPVFSFEVPKTSLIAGIYIDEFSESHTKDLLVRQSLGAAIPSAGVGTLISRELMNTMMLHQGGEFLKHDTLTEDYHLGIMTKPLGFKSSFACVQIEQENGETEFIATREYFPAKFMASVRQKSRWTLGIAYQGFQNLKWQGDWIDRYFLLRDRRAPFNSILVVLSLIVIIGLSLFAWLRGSTPVGLDHDLFIVLMFANTLNMGLRLYQRMRAVSRVNGLSQALMVPVRWLVANAVNVCASYRAHSTYQTSLRTGERPAWVKTDHQLPAHFGREQEAQTQ
ncbi:glycosyltransferase [Bdellovibrio sp. HCB2-146]|uniref:glycosyltransferase n=1 Tax=Bdellovibrio sp. HCB2-146 TaxID=3394362 RepID=UPI0039BCAC44